MRRSSTKRSKRCSLPILILEVAAGQRPRPCQHPSQRRVRLDHQDIYDLRAEVLREGKYPQFRES